MRAALPCLSRQLSSKALLGVDLFKFVHVTQAAALTPLAHSLGLPLALACGTGAWPLFPLSPTTPSRDRAIPSLCPASLCPMGGCL
jgi:hypothetical protein